MGKLFNYNRLNEDDDKDYVKVGVLRHFYDIFGFFFAIKKDTSLNDLKSLILGVMLTINIVSSLPTM